MYSTGLKLKLREGAFEGYRKAHDELWPELADGMNRCGISMAIYRDGQNLFVFATAPTQAQWKASREDPALERWNQHMKQFLETDPGGGLAVEELEQAFGFGDFAPENNDH